MAKDWKVRFKIRILKLMGIQYGPWMIPVRNYWIFIDTNQRVYKIVYTGYNDNPLQITVLIR